MSMDRILTDRQISVIIPVYNCEKYIEEAVSSVLAQSCRSVDIVLVDDGSTDSTPFICDRLSDSNERIHAIHKENGGVSSARNAGIEYVIKASSLDHCMRTYIAFLDADDAWAPGFLNNEVIEVLTQSFDLLGFQSCVCNQNLQNKETSKVMQQTGCFSGGSQNVWIHSSQHFGATFYSVKLLQRYNIRFLEGLKYSEDKIFSLQCMYLADSIWLENRLMYLYRMVPTSAMKTRKFGIPYYGPIVKAYLESDRAMEKWANETRGTMTVGQLCAGRYIIYMIEEHFQQWGSKKEIDRLLEEHPDYAAIMKREPPYQFLPRNPEYEQYEQNTGRYILKQRLLGIRLWSRRCVGWIIKCLQ